MIISPSDSKNSVRVIGLLHEALLSAGSSFDDFNGSAKSALFISCKNCCVYSIGNFKQIIPVIRKIDHEHTLSHLRAFL